MHKTCANPWCQQVFDVSPTDEEFLKKFDCPAPTMCVMCRHQRRAMFFPILTFHRRTSALSGTPLLSIYSQKNSFPVYSIEEWWSDVWDALSFGKPYDPSRTLLEQFGELIAVVPKMANHNENADNCEYSYGAYNSHNCYYCKTIARSQDIFYSEMITGKNDSLIDCYRCQYSSYLVECLLSLNCYGSSYLLRCSNVRDSHFCIDCQGCADCLFCHNLRNKSFHINNKPVDKETFRHMKEEIIDGRYSTLEKNLESFGDVYRATIWRDQQNVNCEDCSGDGLFSCARCHECFNCFNTVDGRYCWDLTPSTTNTNSMDLTQGGIGELLYNCTSLGGKNYYARMCFRCRHSSSITYCIDCFSCKDCFACTGLKNKSFCILNTQYTEEGYKMLVSTIIEHMKRDGDWGNFFHPAHSFFAYNTSSASAYFPLEKEEVIKRGWRWEDMAEPALSGEVASSIPDGIDETDDILTSSILTCPVSGKKFRIQKRELEIYRTLRLPLPRLHPDIRMKRRKQMINPYVLQSGRCGKCGKEIRTTFPEGSENVLCEECYLKEVY